MRTLKERFEAKLSDPDPVTGCIEWTGARNRGGYGEIRCGDKISKAHRVAWELKHGPVPDGLQVLHRCDNPPCCTEEHLFLGDHNANMADMVAKGRNVYPVRKGEKHGRSKLTDADVVEIRRQLAAGGNHRVIAARFGVRREHVSLIRAGKTRLDH